MNMMKIPTKTATKKKSKRVLSAILSNKMCQPYQQINSQTKKLMSGAVSKIWVPVSGKNKKVAARFYDTNRHVLKAKLIEMAKSDCYLVNYKTVVKSDTMEDYLLRYNRS